jgi:cardiolipin synthase
VRYVPNVLSFLRIVLAPYIMRAIWLREYEFAIILCLLAGLSDALDGFLARRFKAITSFGTYLDPLADKILLSGVFVTLALDRAIPWWLTSLVLGRDLLILGFVLWALRATSLRAFPPSLWGKVSTILQIFFLVTALLRLAGYADKQTLLMMMWATAVATLGSGVHYAWTARRLLHSQKKRVLASDG